LRYETSRFRRLATLQRKPGLRLDQFGSQAISLAR
jgi:hypothetical protein